MKTLHGNNLTSTKSNAERILKVVLRGPQDTNTERNNIAEVISR